MKTKALNTTIYNQILLEPEKVIEEFDLVYTNPSHLKITREKVKSSFVFKLQNKIINTEEDLKRIQQLVIPPAWQNVKISKLANGHLQAVGRDVKQRKQYKYHQKWNVIRNQTKFYKMVLFAKHLPKIRKKVDQDLDQSHWTKTKVLALIVKLMEETHIRIGNKQYANKNKTYGLTTLRSRHVNTFKDKIQFQFIGKRGKEHSVSIRNKKLIKLINKCEEIPGWELFKYYDKEGNKQTVDSSLINQYLQQISGTLFTAKDFRTWAASIICFETLLDLGLATTTKQIHKNCLTAIDAAAKELGNTRNVCKKYYIHPAILKSYEDGSIKKYFKIAQDLPQKNPYFTAQEHALNQLFKSYKPLIKS